MDWKETGDKSSHGLFKLLSQHLDKRVEKNTKIHGPEGWSPGREFHTELPT